MRSSEQLEAHASEQPEAQASDEGPEQEIFMDEVKAGYANDSFLAKPNNRRQLTESAGLWWYKNSTCCAHNMCQRVELSESSASAMYMITPTQGM